MDEHKMAGACCGGSAGGACGAGGCRCVHHRVPALCVLLIALAFLLGNLGYLSMSTVSIAWPILIGVAAFTKVFKGMCKCC